MANPDHLKNLEEGVTHWNQWRDENSEIKPDLFRADLSKANLNGANLRDADLLKANLYEANLIGANLHGADLNGANLSLANLPNADLSKANLSKANLRGADLSKANLIRAELYFANLNYATLVEANLSGANLNGANLNGANLSLVTFCSSYTPADGEPDNLNDEERKREAQPIGVSNASFIGADLTGANWTDADLKNTKLKDTILKNADLTGVTSLLAEQLAGTDVTNAKLPANLDEEFEKPLAVIERAAGYARKIYLAMLLGCAYSLLTIFTTDDVALVTNSASSKLPIIGATVPIAGYYLLAPLVLIGFYLYFHISMQRIWENASRLPAVFPDGRSLDRVVDPWLLTGLLRSHLYRLRPKIWGNSRRAKLMSWLKAERAYFGFLQNGFSILLAWGAVPFTVGWMGYAYLTAHDLWPTLFHCGLIAITTTFGVWSYTLARGTLRGTLVESRRSYFDYRAFVGVNVALIVFCLTSVYGLKATGMTESLAKKKGWKWTGYFHKFDYITSREPWIVADLEEKQISKKPANYYELKIAVETLKLKRDIEKSDSSTSDVSSGGVPSVLIEAIQGGDLRNRDLKGAQAFRGFFVRADLRGADLSGANLSEANLSRANLIEANLIGANLIGANLSGANLIRADLSGANLSGANLSGANLIRADLSGAILSLAKLFKAKLIIANLSGAYLRNANLNGANLNGAKYLTCVQIQSARINKKTQPPDYIKITWTTDIVYKCEEIKKEEN